MYCKKKQTFLYKNVFYLEQVVKNKENTHIWYRCDRNNSNNKINVLLKPHGEHRIKKKTDVYYVSNDLISSQKINYLTKKITLVNYRLKVYQKKPKTNVQCTMYIIKIYSTPGKIVMQSLHRKYQCTYDNL